LFWFGDDSPLFGERDGLVSVARFALRGGFWWGRSAGGSAHAGGTADYTCRWPDWVR